MIKLGSHVSMKGKEMLLGAAKEAFSYDADTFMIFTGAPQNTRRKDISQLQIQAGWRFMEEHGIEEFVVHAPYIINLGNTVNPETYKLGVEFLSAETNRCQALGSHIIVLHPGAHVGAGREAGIRKIAEGLNEVLSGSTSCLIALETMAGKGSEIGGCLEDLSDIYDKVIHNDRLRICLDTCHLHDAGYPVAEDFESIINKLDELVGKEQAAVVHINDSKNPRGAAKDRHANIGEGYIGLRALQEIAGHPLFAQIPKILETPYRPCASDPAKSLPPYKDEIKLLKALL